MLQTIDTWLEYSNERKAKNETNDCTVRALASFKGISYDEAHEIMRKKGDRKNGQGCISFMTTKAYESAGLQVNEMFRERPTLAKFLRENAGFNGIIGVRGHVFTIKNGKCYGNWNDAKRTRARVLKAYTQAKSGQPMTKELKKGLCEVTIEAERRILKELGRRVYILDTWYKIVDGEMIIRDKDGKRSYVSIEVGMKRFYAAQRRRTKKAKKVQQQNG